MIRISIVRTIVLLIVPDVSLAQHGPEWLDSEADERWPVPVLSHKNQPQRRNRISGRLAILKRPPAFQEVGGERRTTCAVVTEIGNSKFYV